MTESSMPADTRSYGCSMGCGNPYDYVLVDVRSAEALMVCVPCYVRIAMDMVTALTDPDNPEVARMLAAVSSVMGEPVKGPSGKRGRRNAPAEMDNPDVFEAFDATVTADELSEEFR